MVFFYLHATYITATRLCARLRHTTDLSRSFPAIFLLSYWHGDLKRHTERDRDKDRDRDQGRETHIENRFQGGLGSRIEGGNM